MSAERSVRIRDVFSISFWANYAVILVVTCWLPLTSITATARDAEGNILSQQTSYVRVYRSYLNLLQGHFSNNLLAVMVHVLLSFVICFFVWYALLRFYGRRQAMPEPMGEPDDGNRTA